MRGAVLVVLLLGQVRSSDAQPIVNGCFKDCQLRVDASRRSLPTEFSCARYPSMCVCKVNCEALEKQAQEAARERAFQEKKDRETAAAREAAFRKQLQEVAAQPKIPESKPAASSCQALAACQKRFPHSLHRNPHIIANRWCCAEYSCMDGFEGCAREVCAPQFSRVLNCFEMNPDSCEVMKGGYVVGVPGCASADPAKGYRHDLCCP
jgi:hypothetical protein